MSAVPSSTPIAYTDLTSLRRLPVEGEGLDAVAKQFESLFVDQMLKSMRAATSALSPDPLLGGPELELRQEMLDHQWAIHLSENGGLGLRELITDQLRGGTAHTTPAAVGESALRRLEGGSGLGTIDTAVPVSVQEGFARDLLPIVAQTLAGTDLNPMAVVAQAALETGWGRHTIRLPDGQSSYNLFGIKADAGEVAGEHAIGAVAARTTEYQGTEAERVVARFRVYPTAAAAVADYRDLLFGSPRYAEAVARAKDPAAFADALQSAGYATDPRYGAKLQQVQEYLSSLLQNAPAIASRTD